MEDSKSELLRLWDAAQQAAYQRGWNDAVAHILAAARQPTQIAQTTTAAEPVKGIGSYQIPQHLRERLSIIERVKQIVNEHPGSIGAEIARRIQHEYGDVPAKAVERTVRTALRRLKIRGRITQHEGGWWDPNALMNAKASKALALANEEAK